MAVLGLPDSGGLSEAPIDGTSYNRKDAAWAPAAGFDPTTADPVVVGLGAVAGANALALGGSANAETNCVAVGHQADADATYSVAVGYQAKAQSNSTVCVGGRSSAVGASSTVVGYFNQQATGNYNSVTVGASAQVGTTAHSFVVMGAGNANIQSNESVAIGYVAKVLANSVGSICIGKSASTTNATDGVAIGRAAYAGADLGIALGGSSDAIHKGSISLGFRSLSKAPYRTSIGSSAIFEGDHGNFTDGGTIRQSITTTSATADTLECGGDANQNITLGGTAAIMVVEGTVVAHEAATGDSKVVSIQAAVKSTASVAAIVGTPTITTVAEDAGATAWTVAVGVSGNDLVLTVTGEAAHTIRWASNLMYNEVKV